MFIIAVLVLDPDELKDKRAGVFWPKSPTSVFITRQKVSRDSIQ
jgi:hypothetical protein